MKKALKWILGIVIALVVVAALAGIAYLVVSRWGGLGWETGHRAVQPWEGGRVNPWNEQPRRGMPYHGMPMQPYGRFPAQRYGTFFPLGWMFGGLFCLGFLALIVLGVIALVRSLRRPKQPAAAAVTAGPPAPATVVGPTPAAVNACSNCGREVQEDWSHCPHCGNNLAGDVQPGAPQG